MAIKKDSENRFIIESPNGNTGGNEIIQYVETPKNLIKETIANAITKGVDKSIVESNIRKIINQSLNGCPNDLKSQIRRALVIFAQKEYFTLDHNAKVIAKNFKNRLYNETGYEIPKTQNPIAALTDVNFRNEITDASKGLPIIRDYQRMYREQIRALSVATPKLNKNGKPIPIRLSVETELRYKANKEDLDEAMASDKKLFWISSHADASPRCSPYQGKLYSNDKSLCGKTIDGNKVEALTLDEVCALNGGNSIICGYNCRHYIIEYTKGSKAPKCYDSKTIQKEYAIDQKQRNYEQRIRQLKEEQRLASSIGDKARAKNLSARWHKLEKEYQVFSLQNNRAFYDWRTTVVRQNSKLDENIIVVPIPAPEAKVESANKERIYESINVAKVMTNFSGEKLNTLEKAFTNTVKGDNEVNKILSNLDKLQSFNKSDWNYLNKFGVLDVKKGKQSSYSPSGTLTIVGEKSGTVYHELGHSLDHRVMLIQNQDNSNFKWVSMNLEEVRRKYNEAFEKEIPSEVLEIFENQKNEKINIVREKAFNGEYTKDIAKEMAKHLKDFDYYRQFYGEGYVAKMKNSITSKILMKKVNDLCDKDEEYEKWACLADMFDNITEGWANDRKKLIGSHGYEYYHNISMMRLSSTGNVKKSNTELLANYFELRMSGATKQIELLKKYAPELVDILEQDFKYIGDTLEELQYE